MDNAFWPRSPALTVLSNLACAIVLASTAKSESYYQWLDGRRSWHEERGTQTTRTELLRPLKSTSPMLPGNSDVKRRNVPTPFRTKLKLRRNVERWHVEQYYLMKSENAALLSSTTARSGKLQGNSPKLLAAFGSNAWNRYGMFLPVLFSSDQICSQVG